MFDCDTLYLVGMCLFSLAVIICSLVIIWFIMAPHIDCLTQDCGIPSIIKTSHERHSVSDHQQLNDFFSNLFRLATQKTPKLRMWRHHALTHWDVPESWTKVSIFPLIDEWKGACISISSIASQLTRSTRLVTSLVSVEAILVALTTTVGKFGAWSCHVVIVVEFDAGPTGPRVWIQSANFYNKKHISHFTMLHRCSQWDKPSGGYCRGYYEYTGTPSSLSSHCNSFEDRVPVDEIYVHPIFKWVAVTWLSDKWPVL